MHGLFFFKWRFTMLRLDIPDSEGFDPNTQQFITTPGGSFTFEHSLLAMSKWESIHEKPLLNTLANKPTLEELDSYLIAMCTNTDKHFTRDMMSTEVRQRLLEYIGKGNSATTIRSSGSSGNHQIITSEVMYAAMVESNIPFEAENWNINRLNKLLQVIQIRANPPKKMSRKEVMQQNRELNEARRKQFKSKG